MKRTLVASLLMAICTCCFAIPSRREPFTIKQSDGTTLTLSLIGDETYHYLVTTDGIVVIEEGGTHYYAQVKDERLISTGFLAHDKELRTQAENTLIASISDETKKCVEAKWLSRTRKRNEARVRNKARSRVAPSNGNGTRARINDNKEAITGNKKGLVILVDFPDKHFYQEHTQAEFHDFFNKQGYNKNNSYGSVRDYFYDQSYGKLTIDFDVIGPFTASKSVFYYGKNDSDGYDTHICELVTEICNKANETCDFTKYDWNGDSEVEQVFFVYAGPGEHVGAGANYIWPQEWTLEEGYKEYNDGEGPIFLDDCKINTYAISCELANISGNTITGIGVACHEFSHCFGLPDIYSSNDDNEGYAMGFWDLMSSGSSNGPSGKGTMPCGYTAYERWFTGWLEPIELTEPCTIVDMPCIGESPIAYIIYNDGNRNEYFLLENRQSTNPWYKYTYSHKDINGLLIYHIDYDPYSWDFNIVNYEKNHQRMTIVSSGNNYGDKSFGGYTYSYDIMNSQLFPGSKNVTAFDNTSHTNYGGKLFNKNTDGSHKLNKPVTDIKESDGLISFKFMGGGTEYSGTSIKDIQELNGELEYYNLSGTKITNPALTKGVYIMRSNGITKKVIIN